jgi:hypothetical protein
MLLALVGNVSVDCDAWLSSDALDCPPWGQVIDVGHAVAAVAACGVCIGLLRAPSIGRFGNVVAGGGLAVMAAIGALHLASVIGVRSHSELLQPLVVLWAFGGIWIGLQSVRRRPFDLVSLVGVALALTAVVWSQNVHDIFSDAMRLAGGGFFSIAYIYWIVAVADVRPHQRPAFRYVANPIAAAFQRVAIVVGLAILTIGFLLPFWLLTIFRLTGLGDPSWSVSVTNASSEALNVALDPDGRVVQIPAGGTARLGMGFAPRALDVAAFDRSLNRVFCARMSARDILHARLRITVLRSPETCSGR